MKVGRNDPCPCGSGKKYKQCCMRADEARAREQRDKPGAGRTSSPDRAQVEEMMLGQTGFSSTQELEEAMKRFEEHCESLPANAERPTFMEFLGRPNMATHTQKGVAAAMQGHDFASVEEAERFTTQWMESTNSAPVVEFEGLSSEQMHTILNGRLTDNAALVSLSEELSDEHASSTQMVTIIRWLLAYFAEHEGEIRLTKQENFPRTLVARYVKRLTSWYTPGSPIPLEGSLPELITAHGILVGVGYTEESRTKAWITPEGISTFFSKDWARIYRDALAYVMDDFDWKEWLVDSMRNEHFDLIQSAAPFLVYLLGRHPSGTAGEFCDRFARAFPMYVAPANEDPATERMLRDTFINLVFDYFFPMFGLVACDRPDGAGTMGPEEPYHTTDLFRAAFRFA